ncbi:hypothetical protein BC829DRAFT_405650 [Chytridium lagenaria]|nr:hypothetical protein BC829DRAFT_405650 [Chytridium lagenaria]
MRVQRYLELRDFVNVQVPPIDTLDKLDSRFYTGKHEGDFDPDSCLNCKSKSPFLYRCQRIRCYQLCPDCFVEGHFPHFLTSRDFIKTCSVRGKGSYDVEDFWTDRDCAMLLKAVEQHGSDWTIIAKAVGNFSKEQCLIKFLQLDLADETSLASSLHFESDNAARLSISDKSTESKLGASFLSMSENPLMNLLAVLHHSLSPAISAASYSSMKGNTVIDSMELAEMALETAVKNSQSIASELWDFANIRMQTLTDLELKKVRIKLSILENEKHEVAQSFPASDL